MARTGRVEFATVGDPWVFWSNSSGNVYARCGKGADELVASSAVSISAIMGVANILGAVSEGRILACATNVGAVYTPIPRWYMGGRCTLLDGSANVGRGANPHLTGMYAV